MSCLPNLDKAILRYPTWAGLGTNIRRLDYATDTEPEAVIDRAKAMFETVAKTLLTRLGEDPKIVEPLDVNGLRQKLLLHLRLDESDEKILKNFIDILATNRNSNGIIGHGRDLDREAEIRASIDSVRNNFIITILDGCLCFMIERIESSNTDDEPVETELYSKNEAYNDSLDSDGEVIVIRGVEYKKSELLFYTDRVSYNEGLAGFTTETKE